MKLLIPWLRKRGFKGHPRSLDLKLGVFGVISGQNPEIFKPGQIIYQNDAPAHVITKIIISRSLKVTEPQIR